MWIWILILIHFISGSILLYKYFKDTHSCSFGEVVTCLVIGPYVGALWLITSFIYFIDKYITNNDRETKI